MTQQMEKIEKVQVKEAAPQSNPEIELTEVEVAKEVKQKKAITK